MSNKRILNIILICAMIALSAGIASADGSPLGIPVSLYGTVNIDGNPAPAGTTITAKVGGSAAGDTIVLTTGSYGYPNSWLPVTASSNGAVDFYVNGIKATPSPTFTYNSNDAGKDFQVNLNAPSSTGTATPTSTRTSDASSGTSGTSTGGMGTTAIPTPKGEVLTKAHGIPEAKDTTVTAAATTKAPVSPPFEFSSILGIFVVVVIGAIIIVVLKKIGKI